MSIRAIQAVLDHSPQPPHIKFLLTIIANSENEESGRCDPGVPKLAFYMNCSERNIRKKLDPLIALGELVIEEHEGHSNQYYIPLYRHEVGYYDPGPCPDTTLHRCNGHHGPVVSRAKLALDNNPRYQQRRNHRSEGGTVVQGTPEPQFRGKGGTTVQGTPEPQFRGGGTTVQGTPEPQFSQTGIEPDMNRKDNRNARVTVLNQKQTPERAGHHPSLEPITAIAPISAPTPPPVAPPPPAPPPTSETADTQAPPLGVEESLIWSRVTEIERGHFGKVVVDTHMRCCRLYRAGPQRYILACRTSIQREMLLTRFFNQLKMDLAAVVRDAVDLEVRIVP